MIVYVITVGRNSLQSDLYILNNFLLNGEALWELSTVTVTISQWLTNGS